MFISVCADTPLARHLLIKVEQVKCVISRGFADIMEMQSKIIGHNELIMKCLGVTSSVEDVVADLADLPIQDVGALEHFNSLLNNPVNHKTMVMYFMCNL